MAVPMALVVDGEEYQAYDYLEERRDGAVAIDAKVELPAERFDRWIAALAKQRPRKGEERYFDVVRKGIDSEPIRMRFGSCSWSPKDGAFKVLMTLVEKSYDSERYEGIPMSGDSEAVTRRIVAEDRGLIEGLLRLMVRKGLVSEEEEARLRRDADADLAVRRTRDFSEVADIDEYMDFEKYRN